jgi:hypothetical protein
MKIQIKYSSDKLTAECGTNSLLQAILRKDGALLRLLFRKHFLI